MKLDQPVYIALFSSIFFGVCFAALFFVFDYYVFDSNINSIIATFFTTSFLNFFMLKYLAEQFVAEKINLIQKRITDVKVDVSEEIKRAKNINIADIDQEVEQWRDDFKTEIDELKSREKFRREFIGNVSHELKTPIFNIQGYILTLLDGGLEDKNINLKYLKRAGKSVDRMIDLINDMDTINKLESGIMEFNMVNFDLLELVRDVLDMLEDKAQQSKVSLILQQPKDKTIPVHADPSRIEQVLFNLIINAIKYNKSNGGKVDVSFHDLGSQYLIEIADTGMGIPENDIPRVFERFYRVDKSRVRYTGGSGLGLSIVKHIIDLHRQTINLRSSENVGTTFSFTLKKSV